MFAGHCDVVPTGDIKDWSYDPFIGDVHEQRLRGRGAADMKGALAAMAIAAIEAAEKLPDEGSIYFLSTSDEEGPGIYGTQWALQQLQQQGVQIDAAIVGEPTNVQILGDSIKVGRRGSLSGKAVIHGKQGHVAYPHLAQNAVHLGAQFIQSLSQLKWTDADEWFGNSTLQISNLNAGTGAGNVIPGTCTVEFNIRYSPHQCRESLIQQITQLAPDNTEWQWGTGALPFLSSNVELARMLQSQLRNQMGVEANLNTGGGTSDARFFHQFGIPVIEFGPVGSTMHQVNEFVEADQIETCVGIYRDFAVSFLRLGFSAQG